MKASIAAVVLAAGYASRFGSCKPAALIEGASLLAYCLDAFDRGGVDTVIVVTGARKDEVEAAAPPRWRGAGHFFVHNPRFDEGMFTSVLRGLDAAEYQGVFVHPVDVPLISPSTVSKLVRAFGDGSGKWAVPVFAGTEGHPVLIPGSYKNLLRAWDGAGGLRGFLANREKEKMIVPVADEGILMDADIPSEFENLAAYAGRRHVPGEAAVGALLELAETPSRIIAHQRRVAEVASKIGALYAQRTRLDLPLLVSAAKLHDVLKTEPGHAEKGAAFLEENGFPAVAEIVRDHTDLPSLVSPEAEILYLADKYVNGTEVETLEERERRVRKKFASDGAALKAALGRMQTARAVESGIGKILGCSPWLCVDRP